MTEKLKPTEGIIDFDIFVEGKKIKDTVEVQEITIDMEVNRITSAEIVMQDGGAIGAVNEPFVHSEGADFVPGIAIEISLGYIDKTEKVFKGIIVSQQLKVKDGHSKLIIVCEDKAISMTKGRHNAIFQDKLDSDAIKSIVGNYALDLEMEGTTVDHPILMQYNCSDWDYVVIRAEANNMMVTTYQNKLSVKKINFSETPKIELEASQIVIDIDLRLESENMFDSYNMSSWNPSMQEIETSEVKINDALNQGNLSAKKLSEVLSNGFDAYSSATLSKEEMKAQLEGQAFKAILEKIKGKITVPGTTKIVAGNLILLSGFNSRFNGNAFISRVVHSLQDGDWITELYVGKSGKPHAALPHVEDLGASGLLPPINGMQIATVEKIIEDPDNNFRVLITLPAFVGTGQNDGVWARMSLPYASADAGFFFFPEVGDEVLVTFMNNDPRYPVITGSLYSSIHKPKEITDKKNQFKSIYSKSGIFIKFDDEDKILTIETPSKNTMVLDDKAKSVSIKDMNDNSIIMDESGITMKSPKDINIKAEGAINLTAGSNLVMKATGDATLEGMSVTHKAQTSFTAKGNASAELSASGQTTVKGAMVMIN
ncbi:type VI secretion system tip protein VgrG [Algibacter miyuki]|uniref:Type VI secretion system tip protein VgrG n=1 Tax=Algibacter miyuki TaxID=1306933 RepID=A0ABV5H5N9_9FLAO|nr:type VI secretion system tip protein VgrG [Algibacter miyuki]MDN3663818.1 type VI secretion system tip protein VgrG [Algibacter miyuki]